MKIIKELRETRSNIEKCSILTRLTEIEKKVFYYTYNPFLTYGIKGIEQGLIGEPSDNLFSILDTLAKREKTGYEAKYLKSTVIKAEGCLIDLICNKDLDCGVSAKLFNKVYPGFIPEFNIQLAKEVPLADVTYPTIGQIKFDGVRIIAIVKVSENSCKFFTRSGKQINAPELSSTLLRFQELKHDYVLDGEITEATGKSDERTSISGRINSAMIRKHQNNQLCGTLDIDNLIFNVFDYLPLDEFNKSSCLSKYKVRYQALKLLFIVSPICIKIAKNFIFNSAEEVNNAFKELLNKGYEGLILKNSEHYYTYKRSKDWIKIKATRSVELTCFSVGSGKAGTKYENQIGYLTCKGEVDGVKIAVNVGSGLSDTQRVLNADKFINKIIEVKYNSVIPNKDETGHTLFLPRFSCIRNDLN